MVDYLLVFPERATAEAVAEELHEDADFATARVVRDALAGEDDSEAHDWAVHVQVTTLDDPTGAPARALVQRFAGLAQEHGGWLDEHISPDP